jgi:mRNA interferase RelE/StbE
VTYTIAFHPIAEDQLDDVPARFRWRIITLIESLTQDPYTKGKQMRDPLSQYYRIRLEKWRIVYEVLEDERLIYVHRIKQKTGPETYEDLGPE